MILALGIFAPEVKPIIDQMLIIESGEILGRSYSRGVIGNNEVVACSGFVGKVETAFMTQKLIDHFRPRLVMLLSGEATVVLEEGVGEHAVHLTTPGSFVLVPPNVWHTARTSVPTTMLFLTPGAGTEHRPVAG